MIETTRDRGILTLTLSRPEKKNAFTAAMYEHLSELLAAADEDAAVRVILITGAGNAFSAGNDLDDFLRTPPQDPDAPPFRFLRTIAGLRKPIVAAVNGLAVGIGSTMLFHCDLVYAADSARFSFPFVGLGLVPEGASSLLLPRLVGHRRASEILFFGAPISAGEAREIGLVNQVTPDPVVPFALEQALRLAALPGGAVTATKALLKRTTPEIIEQIDCEARAFILRTTSAAAKEAFSAFFDKRKPDFTGLD